MNIKVPVSWLREYLKTDVTAKTIAKHLSLAGPSVERIEKRGHDYIFDIEVTSNRQDAFSIIGIAREAQAILQTRNLNPSLLFPKGLNISLQPDTTNLLPLEVVIKNQALCPRFSALILDNVKIKPSPAYVRSRLEACAIRAINNIVDISNYLMLELNQPMHAFDYDKIKGATMILRLSRQGEKITTLDGQLRKLPEGTIVIQDSQRLIDLCGIMGGTNSQITKRTHRVVIFVQTYNSQLIRKTTQTLSLRTEAAARFEKGIDLEGILPALSRAVYLAKQTAGAKIASELIDIYPKKQKSQVLVLNLDKLRLYLGVNLEGTKAIQILQTLGFNAKLQDKNIIAAAPSWRTQDIESDVDLIEEIARIYGYHNLPLKLPTGQVPKIQTNLLEKVIELKKALKFLGLTEVISYSIISKSLLKFCGVSREETIELTNPLTEEWQYMRPTLVTSLIDVIAKNKNLKGDLKIFEIAKTYLKQKDDLPKQDLMLTIILTQADFWQIKGVVENVFEILGYDIKFQAPTKSDAIFEKTQSAHVTVNNINIGKIGIVNTVIADSFELTFPIATAEINLTILLKLSPDKKFYKPIPKYPPVIEDISAIFDQKVPVAEILETIASSIGKMLAEIKIIDIFRDEKLNPQKKSVTLRFVYQKSTGTPTQEEVSQARQKIIDTLAKTFQAPIRR